jgi:hypothetical protein
LSYGIESGSAQLTASPECIEKRYYKQHRADQQQPIAYL